MNTDARGIDSQNENIYTLRPPKRSSHFGTTALL